MAFVRPSDLSDPDVFFDHYLWHLYEPNRKWNEEDYKCSDEDKKKYKEIGNIIFMKLAHSDPETLRIIMQDDIKGLKKVNDAVSFLVNNYTPINPRDIIYG